MTREVSEGGKGTPSVRDDRAEHELDNDPDQYHDVEVAKRNVETRNLQERTPAVLQQAHVIYCEFSVASHIRWAAGVGQPNGEEELPKARWPLSLLCSGIRPHMAPKSGDGSAARPADEAQRKVKAACEACRTRKIKVSLVTLLQVRSDATGSEKTTNELV